MMMLGRPLALGFAALVVGGVFFGCSSTSSDGPRRVAGNAATFQKEGSITLSFPIPGVEPASKLYEDFKVLGFSAESASALKKNWLLIDSSAKKLSLMNGPDEIESTPLLVSGPLTPGMATLQHKQRGALWYAPDGYFQARGLPVPPAGDRERYLRGALGEFSLFIDKDTPIHSAPVWSEEVGGVMIQEPVLSKLYYTLQVGDQIEVR